jgi:hypothetical protein
LQKEKPTVACIIDYQVARFCSPAFDALYMIITNTDAQLRNKHYLELLDVYYNKFHEVLCSAGLDSQKIYSRQAFDSDLKIVGPASFIVANTALWLSNGLQEEGIVRSKKVCTTPEEKAAAVNKYTTIIRDIIEDISEYGYISSIV